MVKYFYYLKEVFQLENTNEKNISQNALHIIKKMQQNELTESYIYEEIAKFAKGEDNKKTLLQLAAEERSHYEIWKSYTGIEMKPQKMKVFKFKWIAKILGFTFAVKLSHWSTIRTRFGNTNFRYNFVKMLGNMLNIPCAFSSFYHKICYF